MVQFVKVECPRRFYVNSLVEKENVGRQVKLVLPRRHPVHFLYEASLSEEHFSQNSKLLSRLVSDPSIEGVYETKVCVVVSCRVASHRIAFRLVVSWRGASVC
jgi:hypothetical protein